MIVIIFTNDSNKIVIYVVVYVPLRPDWCLLE